MDCNMNGPLSREYGSDIHCTEGENVIEGTDHAEVVSPRS
jgi:hypothetical protein